MNEERSADLDIVSHWINPNRESTRVGTVSVRVRRLVHHDCNITRTKYGFFVHLPSVPMIDREGFVLKDEASGKWKYKPVVEAIDKTAAAAFSTAVLQLVRERCPEMLGETP